MRRASRSGGRGGLAWRAMAPRGPLPLLPARPFPPGFLHTLLRGVSQDRLDLLGEEYFHYVLKPQLRREAAEKLLAAVRGGEEVVLVSQLLDHVLRPLANHFGISSFVSNRLEFRDGSATGRLVSPVVRPRGPLAWIASGSTDGRVPREKLVLRLGGEEGELDAAAPDAAPPPAPAGRAGAALGGVPRVERLVVRETLANRHTLLGGVPGLLGKGLLGHLLGNVSRIGQ